MSKNVYADMGYENAEEHLLKAEIVLLIGQIIRSKEISQVAVAEITDITQPEISRLLKGHFRGFSIEKLLRIVNALNHNVKIVVDMEEVVGLPGQTTVMANV